MNFGESLAYWYFRLNGFFPLTNFVLHRHDQISSDADADVLAIRFPHVAEPIGGQPDDWDNVRFNEWEFGHRDQIVCVICDVKTSHHARTSIARSFSQQRLAIAMRRFGILNPDEVNGVVTGLLQASVVKRRGITFAKVLMARRFIQRAEDSQCCQLELQNAITFIKNRMKRYRSEKSAARMFFPSDLIQFFAWEAGLTVVDAQPEPVDE